MLTHPKISRLFVWAFVGVMALCNSAQAQIEITYETEGKKLFTVEAPDNWHVTTGSNFNPDPNAPEDYQSVVRVLGMLPEGNPSVWVGLFSPSGVRSIAEGKEYIRELDQQIVSDAKIRSNAKTRFGGREAHVYRGTGKRGRRSVDFSVSLIDLPKDRIAIVVMLGEQGEHVQYNAQLKQIAASFRASN